jgi:hypothetical protein
MKTKAEIIDIVKGALSGGPDKIVQALMDEGCIDASYVEEDMGGEGESKDEGPEIEIEKPDGMGGESESEFAIPKGMPMNEARGVAVKFAMKGMDKKPGKK